MHCKYCGFANGEDDHRCLRCGRRVGVAISAPSSYSGANALAVAPSWDIESKELVNQQNVPADAGHQVPQQPQLFAIPQSNLIAFEQITRHSGQHVPNPTSAQDAPKPAAPARLAAKKPVMPTAEQTSIDFIPAAPPRARTLKTEVEAAIFCEQQVASPMHRFVASSIDAVLIVLSFAVFVATYLLLGGGFGDGKMFWIVSSACFVVVAAFYGSIWAVLGTETAGMRMMDLELITFDGFPVDGSGRLQRFFATWISFCSGGLGILWSLVDEESLTWHDHISKTFPTVKETPTSFVRQRS